MKKNIAVVAGGSSSEYVISLKSAGLIMDCIDTTRFNPYLVVIEKDQWYVKQADKTIPVNRADFSWEQQGNTIHFDGVYNIIHGTPGEDGKIQGYFDLLSIPYTGCNVLTSSITFNKSICKQLVRSHGITTPQSVVLRQHLPYTLDALVKDLHFPCFVKPNNGGSSFGASKVDQSEDLATAIDKAFEHDHEVLIEEYIQGRELTCGVYWTGEMARALPITEIVTNNAFFDFQAKYEGASEEITPARIDEETTERCQRLTERIYTLLGCRGLARLDYIVRDGELYFIEANTTPGCSPESIIPQQIRAADLDIKKIINDQLIS
ncbi:D-alanine--D-alanine ligase [Tunicatimonas pelagia]|uniref:D-alanine--D-alanine ligase n=1 Tax=Tunicatimonas pelagia TaxID=931531 RepID=UPI002666B823|nr:D-alanine--D-alanine ligase [Tunicatimonas pelagia]WKN42008.1 D-alanine--D-alanine ligase [Tunicatimonas pelagia]